MADVTQLDAIARACRVQIIRMLTHSGSGHPGGSLSVIDLLVTIAFGRLRHDPKRPDWPDRDRIVLSKGHAVPALYAVMARAGYFPEQQLITLRKLGSPLQGHPDRMALPGIEAATGSLGEGLSISLGIALGLKLAGSKARVYCILGDGETQEGQIWEAAMSAPKLGQPDHALDEVIADLRPLQAGDLAVDVGCGSGEDTRDLALLVQPGEAVGVDISEAMVAEATRRADAFSSAARFKLASTYELPFKDAEVDVLRCERVIQHLAEPERAMREMFRVVRPGGRIALIDTDWRTIGTWPGERRVTSAVVDAWVDQTVNPAAGSQLADLLISAGFANVTLQPDVLLMRLRDAPDRPPVAMWIDTALKSGKVSAQDADQLRTQLRDAAKTERCVTSVLVMAAQAERRA
jgi:transketolase